MKKLILNNWRAKLISLLLATTLWYLIKKNVATTLSPFDNAPEITLMTTCEGYQRIYLLLAPDDACYGLFWPS